MRTFQCYKILSAIYVIVAAIGACAAFTTNAFSQPFIKHDRTSDLTDLGGTTSVTPPEIANNFFTQLLPNEASQGDIIRHNDGNALFEAEFIREPDRRVGPVFNNTSCKGCHLANGRGAPVFNNNPNSSLGLVQVSATRIERAPANSTSSTCQVSGNTGTPLKDLGSQFQNHDINGGSGEGRVDLRWIEERGNYNDGTTFVLRRPEVRLYRPDGSELGPFVQRSLKNAPIIFGAGLLEAIPDSVIQAIADPMDADQDGISGRPNMVPDPTNPTRLLLGRFGLKASNPSLRHQSAAALAEDMGMANSIFPFKGRQLDISDEELSTIEFYTQTLAVPRARNQNTASVQQGRQLFIDAGCSGCHIMTIRTGRHPEPELSNQTIHPFTDLLLHDMGEGLADNRAEHTASGREWRTPPLWGLGLADAVLEFHNLTPAYLHDGRAGTIAEAILWHGGEAMQASQRFKMMSANDRDSLISFLRSL